MLEKITENNVWNTLRDVGKPNILYGMGNGAEKIVETMRSFGADIEAVFASDGFVRGHSFLNKKVQTYKEICERYEDFNVVLGFASNRKEVLKTIKNISLEHPLYAPDFPIAGSDLFTREYVALHEEKFDLVYNLLADETSKKDYLNILNYKISGKVDYLYDSFCQKSTIYDNILKLDNNETMVDIGAYDGDTIREFIEATRGKYNKIIALEPDEKNFNKLKNNTKHLQGVDLYNVGAWNDNDTLVFSKKAGRNSHLSKKGVPIEVKALDLLINDEVTFIKMDIEGAELNALSGAKNIISTHKPKLYICAYHKNEDLFTLPTKILELNSNYKIYFRHSPYIPAWESNFYCIDES